MAAEIIQLPKKNYRSVRSVDLYFCWDPRLNNPFLNRLFKEDICYVERWYLQTTHLLNVEDTEHPLLRLILNDGCATLNLLMTATTRDLEIQNKLTTQDTLHSTNYNLRKLNRWRNKWVGLINYCQLDSAGSE